jgi:ribose transport system ATP-binding protein
VTLSARAGEVHALVGHNGSGKSTLIKILAGVHRPDHGWRGWIGGEPLEHGFSDPRAKAQLRFVHQDLGVVLEFNAVDNIALTLGYSRGRGGRISWREQLEQTGALLDRFGVDIDLERPLSAASPVQRTAVAVARAVGGLERGAGVLVLDEPTASLPPAEVDRLFKIVDEVRREGTAVLYISHRLDEVFSIAHRVTVLREGRVVVADEVDRFTRGSLADAIAGHHVARPARKATEQEKGPVRLSVRGLSGPRLHDLDLTVRAGEVVGVAGLLGSGREVVPYAISGALGSSVTGSWTVDGAAVEVDSVLDALRAGIALVPADRQHESVVEGFNVRENASLAGLAKIRRHGGVTLRRERPWAEEWLERLDVVRGRMEHPIATLSGGNQQKVIIGRWLASEPRILLLNDPTRGIDINAKRDLYKLLSQLASEGLAVVMLSTELDEHIELMDRVLVFREQELVAEIGRAGLTRHALLGSFFGETGANGEKGGDLDVAGDRSAG